MPKTPGKMHIYDMVNIDITVFEIVGGAFKATSRIVSCLKWPGSDRVNIIACDTKVHLLKYVFVAPYNIGTVI